MDAGSAGAHAGEYRSTGSEQAAVSSSLLPPSHGQANGSRVPRTMCFRPDRLISKSWCGTGPFLSPEALLGDVSPAADMWAAELKQMYENSYPHCSLGFFIMIILQRPPQTDEGEEWAPHALFHDIGFRKDRCRALLA